MKILAFGEILWDVYPEDKYIGGAPLNFAAHLARHSEDVYLLSAIGRDELGDEALTVLEKWNISADHVGILDDIPTGKCVVSLDGNGVPSYDLWSGVAYDNISCNKIPDDFGVLYFGTLSLRSEHNFTELEKLVSTHSFSEIFVDVNIRPPHYSEKTVRFAAENATMIKISDEEMDTVAELLGIGYTSDHKAFAKTLSKCFTNLHHIIITLGSKGAYVLRCTDGVGFSCGTVPVEVKSTVGAGDSFSAAFLHRYLTGDTLSDCLTYASKIAAFVVSNYDAVPEYGV